jgi:hypothetical protein
MNRVSSGDYINAKKQNAIYNEIKFNAQHTIPNTTNPVKLNGVQYNNNINLIVPNNCTPIECSGGILQNAKSYDLLYGFNHGKIYNYNRCQCNTSSETQGPCQADANCLLLGKCCSCFTCALK